MKASNLAKALSYHIKLGQIRTLMARYQLSTHGDGIAVQYGDDRVDLSKCARDEMLSALLAEERMILNTLAILRVELEE